VGRGSTILDECEHVEVLVLDYQDSFRFTLRIFHLV
jgi:hypothetical protein